MENIKKDKTKDGRFIKGNHYNISTEFKKGNVPWCAGTKGIVKAWNKGKKMPEISGINHPMYGKHPTPWNKGLTKEKDERLKKMGFQKGHKVSEESIKKLLEFNKINGIWSKGKKVDRSKFPNMGHFKPHSEETKNNYKEKRKNWITPSKDTLIEVKIQNFLETLGIDYFKHKYMNITHGYQCDIFIPSINLVIECDGDYWHKYPTGRDIDKIRTSELIEKGFKVLRIWERDIKIMSIDEFNQLLNNGGQSRI